MPTLTGTLSVITGGDLDPTRVRQVVVRAPDKRASLGTSDRLVTTAPARINDVTGEISVDLEPGPALLIVNTMDSNDVYELYVTADMTLLTEAANEAAPAHERSWVESQLVQLRTETETLAGDAVTAAGTATSAAGQAAQDRAHVDSIRQQLDEAAQSNVAPYLTQTELNATYGTKSDVAARVQVVEAAYDVHRSGAVGDGTAADRAALNAAFATAGDGAVVRLRPGRTYAVEGGLAPRRGQKIEANGATILYRAGSASFNLFQAAAFGGSGDFTITFDGGTIDGNKANVPAPADKFVSGLPFYFGAASGWAGRIVVRGVRVRNLHALAARVTGSSTMGSTAGDGKDAAESAVLFDAFDVDGANMGIFVDRANGVTISNPLIRNTLNEGIYDTMSRGTRVMGGEIRSCGGHGYLTQYSYASAAIGLQSRGNTKAGFAAGGGIAGNGVVRRFQWIGCAAENNGHSGFQVDPTKSGAAPGQTELVNATMGQCIATSNGKHGFYLHNAREAALQGCIATDNGTATGDGFAYAGLALDSYRVTVDGGVFTRNPFGINFQGGAGDAGQTGYGHHSISRTTKVFGNSQEDFFMGTGTLGWQGTALELDGDGAPEGVVRATVGSTYRRLDTGDMYVKTTFTPGTGANGKAGWKLVTRAA